MRSVSNPVDCGLLGTAPGVGYKALSKADRAIGPSGAARRRYRTIWISDVHLGTRGCNCRLLIDFLDHCDSDTLYLVGDIIDGWRMKKRFFWPERHNAIVRRLMKKAKGRTRVEDPDCARGLASHFGSATSQSFFLPFGLRRRDGGFSGFWLLGLA